MGLTAALLLKVIFMDPGFVPMAATHTGLAPKGAGIRFGEETEGKSGHKPVASDVGLLSKETVKSTPATDSSYIVTTPAVQSPREPIHMESEEQPAVDEDGPISISIFGANPLHSERESVSYEGEIVEHTEGRQETPAAEPISLPPKSDERKVSYETRYCTLCRIEQPVRAKHCKACNRCLSLHDHHCPWLGVCIAERNRFYFYWYLVAETCLLAFSLILVLITQTIPRFQADENLYEWVQTNGALLLAFIIEAGFALMVTSLLAFHTYLACLNTTTWEHLSWTKISYLQNWPRTYGSPFSKGPWHNIKTYCCPLPQQGYMVWVLPQTLPEKPRRCC